MRWEKKQIEIQLRHSAIQVDALVSGNYAIHKAINHQREPEEGRRRRTLSDTVTGYRFTTCRDKKTAIALAGALEKLRCVYNLGAWGSQRFLPSEVMFLFSALLKSAE